MESLQGPINPCFLEQQMDVKSLREVQEFVKTESLALEEEEEVQQFSTPSLEDAMPFLQMLQSAESSPFLPFKGPNFLALLSLQHLKNPLELGKYVTHEAVDFHSTLKSDDGNNNSLHHNPISTSCTEGVNLERNQEFSSTPAENMCREAVEGCSASPPCTTTHSRNKRKERYLPPTTTRERKKRKRIKPTKNREEVENQRMTHIAVERNRRRQMNDHLNCLRFLMPPSYIQRGDQASIIGGAIDFVKELEQLLQSLEAEKRTKQRNEEETKHENSLTGISSNETFASSSQNREGASLPQIQVTLIQNHVNLKIQCLRKQGQLLKSIVSLEELRLSVLHLNVSSLQASAFYSFSLKVEDDCKLGTASEIAAAVHQIFNQIDGR